MKRIENFIKKTIGLDTEVERISKSSYIVNVDGIEILCEVSVNLLTNEIETDKFGDPIFKVQTSSYGMVTTNSKGANAVAVQHTLLTYKTVQDYFIDLTRDALKNGMR